MQKHPVRFIEAIIKIMKPFTRYETGLNIKGEWKSEFEEVIYVFSDSPSILKKDWLDLLVSDIKSNNYFLMMYSIFDEHKDIFIEMGNAKSSVRYKVTYSVKHEIHLEDCNKGLLILKKL